MDRTVLVVDDRATPRRLLASELADAGFRVLEAADGREAWARFREEPPDLVITDLVMPRSDGIELVGRIRAHASRVPVIVFTGHGTVSAAVAALKSGADEFVASSDVDVDGLVSLAQRFLGRQTARDAAGLAGALAGESPALRRVRERVMALAALREPVLVSGEPGTGRDAVARTLHELAHAARGPFTVVRPEQADAPGALPGGGTVYLDDVERFSRAAQRHFDSVLEELDAHGQPGPRFVVSAGPALASRVAEGAFDRGLGTRLLRFEVCLPPLRDRAEDVPRLARLFLERAGQALGRPGMRFDGPALERLRREHWPGNVAELLDIVEKLVGFSSGREIGRAEVDDVLAEFRLSVASLRERAACEERRRLVDALRETGGNVAQAAVLLGRSRAAIYRLVEKHGVPLRREF